MNKKINRIELIFVIIVAIIIFGGITNVNAKTTAECKYKTKNSFGQDIQTFGAYIKNGNIVITGVNVPTGFKGSQPFKVVDGTLYCPDKIYLILNEVGVLNQISVQYDDDNDSEDVWEFGQKYTSNFALKFVIAKNNGYSEVYTPIIDSEGKARTCSTTAAIDMSLLAGLKERIDSANADDFKQIVKELETIDPERPCSAQDKKTLSDKWKEVSTALEEKINSSDLTDKDKESTLDDLGQIRNKRVFPEYEPKKLYRCEAFDPMLKAVIQKVLLWVRIAVPILLIILVALDFSQAVISQDQEAVKKAISKSIKRAIAALVVFFIPFLVSLMISWLDKPYDTFEITGNDVCTEVIN